MSKTKTYKSSKRIYRARKIEQKSQYKNILTGLKRKIAKLEAYLKKEHQRVN